MMPLQQTIDWAYTPALERYKKLLDRIEYKRPQDTAIRALPAAVRATINRTGKPAEPVTWIRRDTPLLQAIRTRGKAPVRTSIERYKIEVDRKHGEAIDLDDERTRLLFTMPNSDAAL